ncbi:SCO family protein [Humisphaera borealis]|uniref:SCO family protein n=1 Tax=Humisphaera borealis TaxID=2807512 RepID=A0A7M2WWC4_9BACT|nr:SCO family protein [Humisphaera borealis]QOV89689.1 SCO family protein [Humisphaera borealis]
MANKQKILTTGLWAILLLAMVGVVAGKLFWPKSQNVPEVLFPAANFALTDQNGQAFGNDRLSGKPYIAAFVFTQCASICPKMTAEMSRLQGELPKEVQLISFSVDPQRDTPAVLKQYAATHKADEARWHFLTGDRDAITAVARDMKLVFQDGSADHPILHSPRILLVDDKNQIRGTYNSQMPEDLKKLVEDAKYIAGHPGGKS